MKVSKTIVIILSVIFAVLLPILIYYYSASKLVYNILVSIMTGIIVSLITSLCQYFVCRKEIKDKIFNCYFELYKAIYASEHTKLLFHYNVVNIYKKSIDFDKELSKYISEYSGFISNKRSKLYKKLNPNVFINFNMFNKKNFIKLIIPFNSKQFNNLIISIKEILEQILRIIDYKKFDKDVKDFIKIFNNFNCK